ncbi:deoxyuridine 5'-triphosphate nucleotidohydrolase [Clostridia bacterium]|nr:deoxyuridine 5'-triphosphate nucleotidohydrolase [Clostridia bacterium]
MTLKIRKTHAEAVLPSYAHAGDSGLDLRSVEARVIAPGERVSIRTGLSVELPRQHEAQIRPRSGLAINHGVTTLNSPGTIDEGYRGEIRVILINLGDKPFAVERGMRVAQMVIAPVTRVDIEEVTDLSETERGAGGFGSTGVE